MNCQGWKKAGACLIAYVSYTGDSGFYPICQEYQFFLCLDLLVYVERFLEDLGIFVWVLQEQYLCHADRSSLWQAGIY